MPVNPETDQLGGRERTAQLHHVPVCNYTVSVKVWDPLVKVLDTLVWNNIVYCSLKISLNWKKEAQLKHGKTAPNHKYIMGCACICLATVCVCPAGQLWWLARNSNRIMLPPSVYNKHWTVWVCTGYVHGYEREREGEREREREWTEEWIL